MPPRFMNKKILPALLLAAVCSIVFVCCKKSSSSPAKGDPTMAYFPTNFGKYVVYNVDSVYYDPAKCKTTEKTSQLRYSVSDTFRDATFRLSYIMDVMTRPNNTASWTAQGVVYLTNTGTSLEYVQSGLRTIKLVFPVAATTTWMGNSLIPVNDSNYMFLNNWQYSYQSLGNSYNTPYENFANTVTVLENNETVSNGGINSDAVPYTLQSYAKEIYALNVGMIYRETKYLTYNAKLGKCVGGYTLVMQAVDHN
jgi:hypothetical protein